MQCCMHGGQRADMHEGHRQHRNSIAEEPNCGQLRSGGPQQLQHERKQNHRAMLLAAKAHKFAHMQILANSWLLADCRAPGSQARARSSGSSWTSSSGGARVLACLRTRQLQPAAQRVQNPNNTPDLHRQIDYSWTGMLLWMKLC